MPKAFSAPITSAMKSAAVFIQGDYDANSLVPGKSPAAVEMAAAAEAIDALLEAVRHEGAVRAIDAGQNVTEWRSHLSPVLGAAYDRAAGPV